jgi:hypothetical protein
MFSRRIFILIAVFVSAALLSGCADSLRRDDDAAKAKTRMIGMSRVEVLSCMGPPKKKAHEDTVEVWSYLSTDDTGTSRGNGYKPTPLNFWGSSHEKSFCTVNVVMKDGVVTAIHYLGPTKTSFYNDNDQCGFAVAACVEHGAE